MTLKKRHVDPLEFAVNQCANFLMDSAKSANVQPDFLLGLITGRVIRMQVEQCSAETKREYQAFVEEQKSAQNATHIQALVRQVNQYGMLSNAQVAWKMIREDALGARRTSTFGDVEAEASAYRRFTLWRCAMVLRTESPTEIAALYKAVTDTPITRQAVGQQLEKIRESLKVRVLVKPAPAMSPEATRLKKKISKVLAELDSGQSVENPKYEEFTNANPEFAEHSAVAGGDQSPAEQEVAEQDPAVAEIEAFFNGE